MIEAMQQALEALEKTHTAPGCEQWALERKACIALRTAIEAAEKQEPVAWAVFEGWNAHDLYLPQEYDEALKMAGYKGDHAEVKPLYTTPPAAAQRQPMTAWQPIERALPEPGKPVLAACGKQVVRAVHAPKFTLSEDDWGEFLPEGEYNEATDTSYWPEGWYEWNHQEETHWQLDNEPTHWMPLPDAPAAHGIKEKNT
jgi:hypothetical protein